MNPVVYIRERLNAMIASFVLAGVIFFLLGLGVIVMPTIIQYFFVIGFVVIGISMFVVAARLVHIREFVAKLDIFKR